MLHDKEQELLQAIRRGAEVNHFSLSSGFVEVFHQSAFHYVVTGARRPRPVAPSAGDPAVVWRQPTSPGAAAAQGRGREKIEHL